MRQRRSSISAFALIALAITVPAVAHTAVQIDDILRHSSFYDDHDISVFGKVRGLAYEKRYARFQICNPHCLNVLVWGHPRVSSGEPRLVHGRYYTLKEIDHREIHNLIEVQHGAL